MEIAGEATRVSPEIRAVVAALLPALARLDMEPVQTRAPITQRVRFEKGATSDWRKFADEYGITNKQKLEKVLREIEQSLREYKDDLRRMIRLVLQKQRAGQINALQLNELQLEDIVEALEPHLLFVRIIGHTDADGTPDDNRKISQAWAESVKDALVELNANRIPHLAGLLIPLHKGSEVSTGKTIGLLG